jgi:hypothetical protein
MAGARRASAVARLVRGALAACMMVSVLAAELAGGAGGGAGGGAADDEALPQRMRNFQQRVCNKCAKRDVYCGCELGDANPPFALLRSYARQTERWRRQIMHASPPPDLKWVLVDVEGGAGNQLIHIVGALMLAVSLGRPLALKHNTVLQFPFDPVLPLFDGRKSEKSVPEPKFID